MHADCLLSLLQDGICLFAVFGTPCFSFIAPLQLSKQLELSFAKKSSLSGPAWFKRAWIMRNAWFISSHLLHYPGLQFLMVRGIVYNLGGYENQGGLPGHQIMTSIPTDKDNSVTKGSIPPGLALQNTMCSLSASGLGVGGGIFITLGKSTSWETWSLSGAFPFLSHPLRGNELYNHFVGVAECTTKDQRIRSAGDQCQAVSRLKPQRQASF